MDLPKEVRQQAIAASGATDVAQSVSVTDPSSNGSPRKKRRIVVPAQYAGLVPTTPPLQPVPATQASPRYAPQAALSPMPVATAAAVPAIPPSPLMVTHGWKRMASRSQPGV